MRYWSERARALNPYAAGRQPRESGWIKLNTNENPYPPSPKVMEALRRVEPSELRLYPDGDSGAMRAAAAKNLGVGVENVFAGNGSDEVLALAFQAFFSGRENVLTPDISYGFYPVWSQLYGVGTKTIPLKEDLTVDTRDYRGGRGVILANPNAPTGLALTRSEVGEIARNNPNGVVVIDEAYIDFSGVDSAVGLIGTYDNLLVTRTFSKSYALAGLRIGFAVGDKSLIDGLRRVKNAFNAYPLGLLAQTGATAAMEDVAYWDEARRRVIRTRGQTADKLRAMGRAVTDSQTNFLLMEAENAKALYEYLYENKILVRYWDTPAMNRFLRITVGTDAEMEAFINCMERQRYD